MKNVIPFLFSFNIVLFLATAASCGGGKKEAAEPSGVVEQPAPDVPEAAESASASATAGSSMTQNIVALKSGDEIGKRKILVTREGDMLTIAESVDMSIGGKDIGWKSTVTYSTAQPVGPVVAAAETTTGGKPCMMVSVAFKAGQAEISATLLTDSKGEDIDPPMKADKSMPLAQETIVFHSALLAVGPLLLPRQGELKGVVLAEFPDDIDEPINLKKDYKLVRTDKADGGYVLSLYSPNGQDPVYSIDFDSKGQCLCETAFNKFKFIPEMQSN